MDISRHRARIALLSVLALAVAPYFVGLGASSLWDSNEAFYAETPREMIESGDLINPSFNYQPRFNKPPLSYWVVAASYKLFGVSEAVERLSVQVYPHQVGCLAERREAKDHLAALVSRAHRRRQAVGNR